MCTDGTAIAYQECTCTPTCIVCKEHYVTCDLDYPALVSFHAVTFPLTSQPSICWLMLFDAI